MGLQQVYNQFDDETKQKFDEELDQAYEANFGPQTSKMLSFEVLVAVDIK